MPSQYQVVIQFREPVLDYDSLIELEEALIADVGPNGDLDGHDLGSREANIFMLTPEPNAMVQVAKLTLTEMGLLDAATIAFRHVAGEHYAVVWPQNYEGSFSVA